MVKIKKYTATPTNVIVYFDAPLDVPADPNNLAHPTRIANYTVARFGAPVTVLAAQYDAVNQAVVLQLGSAQNRGDRLLVRVANVTSGNITIATNSSFEVRVGDEPPTPAPPPPTTPAQPADTTPEQLRKILSPSYAIGMNIITQDQYDSLRNRYSALSELSLGLILPMILIVLGLTMIPQLGLAPPGGLRWLTLQFWTTSLPSRKYWSSLQWLPEVAWLLMCIAMVWISEALFVVATERYHKFRMELKLLIEGNWQKLQDAKPQKPPAGNGGNSTSSKAIQTAVANAISKANAIQELNVNVDTKG